jgi:phosphotransferase system enzyme I (PtsP)
MSMKDQSAPRDDFSVVVEVSRIVSDTADPDEALQRIADLIASSFALDVCSIYLVDKGGTHLELAATVGLNSESVGSVRMRLDEGLTGMAAERMEPVFVTRPWEHARFKYFRESGEESYNTFLGVPLVYQQELLGVLVVQTRDEEGIAGEDISVYSAIASQVSAMAAYTGLLNSLRREREESRLLKRKLSGGGATVGQSGEKRGLLRGLPVSSGFGQGYAHYMARSASFEDVEPEECDDPVREKQRIREAFETSRRELAELVDGVQALSSDDRAVLKAHQMLLDDASLIRRIEGYIAGGSKAEYGLKQAVLEYLDLFEKMQDSYLRERGRDVEDVGRRVLNALYGTSAPDFRVFDRETVLIAPDISPPELVGLKQENLKGIVLSKGGKTSHAVILAKSFEIPTVIRAREVLDRVRENDRVIVDGTSGLVYPNPTTEIVEEYRRLSEERKRLDSRLSSLRELPGRTRDGRRIALGANIGLLSDLELVGKYGADHIGLYRTEFPFLARREFPTEEEQFRLYKSIAEASGGREVTIRTLDVGGDKFLSYLDYPKEANPYLGWRSIRVSLELESIFRAQVRAVMRASAFGPLRIMFPMITSAGEVQSIRSLLREEKLALRKERIDFDESIPAGIMVEVPAAVKILQRLADMVDFVSIGTNDLIQYTLAVDRNNPKVAPIYNPMHPSVLATVNEAVGVCRRKGVPIGICGEASADAGCAYLFLGMGAETLSMNAASIPGIKDMLRRVRTREARKDLRKVLDMVEAGEIRDYVDSRLPRLSPD